MSWWNHTSKMVRMSMQKANFHRPYCVKRLETVRQKQFSSAIRIQFCLVSTGFINVVELLLKNGADPNLKSPLELAVVFGNLLIYS